jgi:hypothetical protein
MVGSVQIELDLHYRESPACRHQGASANSRISHCIKPQHWLDICAPYKFVEKHTGPKRKIHLHMVSSKIREKLAQLCIQLRGQSSGHWRGGRRRGRMEAAELQPRAVIAECTVLLPLYAHGHRFGSARSFASKQLSQLLRQGQ